MAKITNKEYEAEQKQYRKHYECIYRSQSPVLGAQVFKDGRPKVKNSALFGIGHFKTPKNITSRSFDILFETAMHIFRQRMVIATTPISYHFSNSSLNKNVLGDCMKICLKAVIRKI